MCTVCITYAKMCKTWSMSDLISYIHTYIHTYSRPRLGRSLSISPSFLKLNKSLVPLISNSFNEIQYRLSLNRINGINTKQPRGQRGMLPQRAMHGANVLLRCRTENEERRTANEERRTKKSLSSCGLRQEQRKIQRLKFPVFLRARSAAQDPVTLRAKPVGNKPLWGKDTGFRRSPE